MRIIRNVLLELLKQKWNHTYTHTYIKTHRHRHIHILLKILHSSWFDEYFALSETIKKSWNEAHVRDRQVNWACLAFSTAAHRGQKDDAITGCWKFHLSEKVCPPRCTLISYEGTTVVKQGNRILPLWLAYSILCYNTLCPALSLSIQTMMNGFIWPPISRCLKVKSFPPLTHQLILNNVWKVVASFCCNSIHIKTCGTSVTSTYYFKCTILNNVTERWNLITQGNFWQGVTLKTIKH